MKQPTAAILLAAGLGKRMRSPLAKVLHPCCDVPLIAHVVKAALQAELSPIVVVLSPQGNAVEHALRQAFPHAPLRFAVQEVARGTGDAARAGLAALTDLDLTKTRVAIAYGDAPLIRAHTFQQLNHGLETPASAKNGTLPSIAFLTAMLDNPFGYGRVVRPDPKQPLSTKNAVRIVEQKDATPDERAIHEVNAGMYLCHGAVLRDGLAQLSNHNAQGEYYLTDVIAFAAQHGGATPVIAEDANDTLGVNSRAELARVQTIMRQRLVACWHEHGVTFDDPDQVFISADTILGTDVVIGYGVQLRGTNQIGDGVVIEGPTVIQNAIIGDGAIIHSFSHIEQATVGAQAHVGPYARLRPQTILGLGTKIGNFVEIKKSTVGDHSKVNHLAYVGDTHIGTGSNIGAGTITCNYDGQHKHPTTIGNNVFVGSNSTLVAPLRLHDGAYVAAGSTITRDVPGDALAFGRARQQVREQYATYLRARTDKT